jgi:two-component system CheB/CheR fusion protein
MGDQRFKARARSKRGTTKPKLPEKPRERSPVKLSPSALGASSDKRAASAVSSKRAAGALSSKRVASEGPDKRAASAVSSKRASGAATNERAAPVFSKPEPARSVEQSDASTANPPVASTANANQIPHAFPVVGIGASAGGLEALEQFLKHMPVPSGAAYVVVQHLDPTHKGMLVELLQRSSTIAVVQAQDGMQVEPEHCYVIPPNKDMSLLQGRLHLLPQALPRGLNLPIDFFLRSLAADQQEHAIAVILSGMGSDGTLGVRAIKERGGAAFVQALESAKFDSMPRSVIDTGLADVIAPVQELPERIVAYREHTPFMSRRLMPEAPKNESALEKVFVLLRAQTGNDFLQYKRSTIHRRIERRLGLHQIDSTEQYVRYLRENPREVELLFKELLIGVTNFFRDPPAWEHLKLNVMPSLLDAHGGGGALRAWVPGCSTGEEAYSLAMIFKESIEHLKPIANITLQIFATDLDREAIEKARLGVYPNNIAADVSSERLVRFFVQESRGYRIGKEIREMVVFAPQNLIMDPPFTKLDILSCRNLMIYLSSELQKTLIPLFYYSLNPKGLLFLGSAETIGSFSNLFAPLDAKTRLYRRLDQGGQGGTGFEFPSTFVAAHAHRGESARDELGTPPHPPTNFERLADRVLVQRFAPLGVLCSKKGDVLYISGRAGKYFEPAVGKANLNVVAMARDGLRNALSDAFAKASREGHTVSTHGVIVGTNGGRSVIDLTVQPLHEPRQLRGTVLVVIKEVSAARPPSKASKTSRASEQPRIVELEQDLSRAQAEAQSTREEMQTSQEELKSTNEELQSSNEELQSTNEELTTSKEEMQSLNEELHTVNHELQSKVDELSRSNNDMTNLLNSTAIATLFLDNELRVRRFTTPTSKIIKLIPTDAGRPITDIASDLEYTGLADDAREVLRTLVFRERQESTRDGRWFNLRIMPYRTLENVIDGLVITFTDASAARALESSLREQASELRQMAESLPALVWGCRPDGNCDYVSPRWVEYTGAPARELLHYGWLNQVHPDDREEAREAWRVAVEAGTDLNREFRVRDAGGAYRWFQTRAVPIRDGQGAIVKWYGTNTDVDDLKRAEVEREQSLGGLLEVVANLDEGFFALDSQRVIVSFNPAAGRLVAREPESVLGQPLLEAFPEVRGSAFDTKITEAFEHAVPVAFELSFAPGASLFQFRVFPRRPDGVSILFERPG